MVCRKCGIHIDEKQGERAVFGYGYEVDENGKKVPDSDQTLGFFHADCWAEVKAQLGPEPTSG